MDWEFSCPFSFIQHSRKHRKLIYFYHYWLTLVKRILIPKIMGDKLNVNVLNCTFTVSWVYSLQVVMCFYTITFSVLLFITQLFNTLFNNIITGWNIIIWEKKRSTQSTYSNHLEYGIVERTSPSSHIPHEHENVIFNSLLKSTGAVDNISTPWTIQCYSIWNVKLIVFSYIIHSWWQI